MIHSPLVEKIEITKRSKVRRNNLSYMRKRSGKSARLAAKDFDRVAVNDVSVPEEPTEEASVEEIKEEKVEEAKEEVKEEKAEEPKEEAKVEEPKAEA